MSIQQHLAGKIKRIAVNLTAATVFDTLVLIPAVEGHEIAVVGGLLSVDTTMAIRFSSGSATDDLSGNIPMAADAEFKIKPNPLGHFRTNAGEALILQTSVAAGDIDGWLIYMELPNSHAETTSQALVDGLSTWWDFEEADSGPYTDSLGLGLDFDEFNAIGKATGQPGTGITATSTVSGNARCDYADFTGNESVLLTTQDFSISFWLYITGSIGETWRLFTTNGSSTSNPGIRININTSDQVFIHFRDDTTAVIRTYTDGLTTTDDAWNHIVVTCDRDGDMEVFIDAVSAGTKDISTVQNSIDDNAQAWRIGQTTTNWTGTFDSLGVWNRLLTASDISLLYNGGAGVNYPF